ncbi:G-protein-coupled receptor family 3 protein 3 [Tieghemostelium lacteum]|uniref:G-protein-coupled receptor family 3 protein 3 n=1 Tax=Tieghemostelium lacteum TaxID=361077 RepID=A0A152A2B2_TIELA|nr:G-protein-coupled receptor family 3 protein 3 [Tieghemostelium lacteum]|eukprot:KYR00378.1 G-protein-coupled receptor family 3 protein 3 [Tieghemostelium lacteum]
MDIKSIDVKDLKIAVILYGQPNDLGFNYQLTLSKVYVERFLKSKKVSLFSVGIDSCERFLESLADIGYNVIITTSEEHAPCAQEISLLYPDLYIMIRGLPQPTFNRSMFADVDYEAIYFLTGFFAGLMTKTNVLGFISPGAPIANDYPANTFFVGARQSNPDVTLLMFNIGSRSNAELSSGASKALYDMGVDVIGQSLNDMSVSMTSLEYGYIGMGTNGYDQRQIYGNKIDISLIMNWTMPYMELINAAKADKTKIKFYSGSLKNNFITLEYGANVSDETRDVIEGMETQLKFNPVSKSPYLCNPYNRFIFKNVSTVTNCIDLAMYRTINDPYPGMTNFGNFSIPVVARNLPKTITRAFPVTSGVLIAICLILLLIIIVYRDSNSIRAASPLFCGLIVFGAIIVYSGIIIWSLPPSNLFCNLRYWLVSIGFTTLIGSLVVKNFRIWLIFDNPHLKTIKITNFQLFPWILTLEMANVILMGIITSRGQVESNRVYNIDDLTRYEYMQVCQMNQYGTVTLYVLLVYFALLLFIGLFVSWKLRIVDIAEFNESKTISSTLYTIFFILFSIVCLLVVPQYYINQTIILCIAGIFITSFSLFIIFIPKLLNLWSPTSQEKSLIAEVRFTQKLSTPDGADLYKVQNVFLSSYSPTQKKNLATFTDDTHTIGNSSLNLNSIVSGDADFDNFQEETPQEINQNNQNNNNQNNNQVNNNLLNNENIDNDQNLNENNDNRA